ncbi:MAG: ThiF family adenylyltransferase [Phycisphaerae bacterium]|nr:ThiF family adenylyltransferase [Phycisphaerae bacterium]
MPIDPAAARLDNNADLARYSRQILFHRVGPEGQQRLAAARVAVIGCGALGSALANLLARAGVGYLRIIDRDYIELNNLQRQTLFDEQDIADNLPKAAAAARKIARINSAVAVEPIVADVTPANVESLCDGVDLLLDGLDNLDTRYLMNDAAVRHGRPWIYGACIGVTGMMMPIRPGVSPCLRCIFPEPPPPGAIETCDTAGILGPVVDLVAAWQSIEALKLLLGRGDDVQRRLMQLDAWSGEVAWFDMAAARDPACVCCGQRRFEFLEGRAGGRTATLCGRDAVQIAPRPGTLLRFEDVAARVAPFCPEPPTFNRFLLRFRIPPHEVTLFPDGRAIIKGTTSPDEARTLYSRYIGD